MSTLKRLGRLQKQSAFHHESEGAGGVQAAEAYWGAGSETKANWVRGERVWSEPLLWPGCAGGWHTCSLLLFVWIRPFCWLAIARLSPHSEHLVAGAGWGWERLRVLYTVGFCCSFPVSPLPNVWWSITVGLIERGLKILKTASVQKTSVARATLPCFFLSVLGCP